MTIKTKSNIITSKDTTKVIFRWFLDDVIAIFPEEVGTNQPYTCMSYMHIGQHSSCNPDYVIQNSIPIDSNNTEQSYLYRCLYEELESMGYKLQEVTRHTRNYYEKRKALLKQMSR